MTGDAKRNKRRVSVVRGGGWGFLRYCSFTSLIRSALTDEMVFIQGASSASWCGERGRGGEEEQRSSSSQPKVADLTPISDSEGVDPRCH